MKKSGAGQNKVPKPKQQMRLTWMSPKKAQNHVERAASVVNNRTVYWDRVHRIAREIEGGHWEITGEPIILDEKGFLIDGQHRLHAIIESGFAVWVWVCTGPNRKKSLPIINMENKPRRLEDLIKMEPLTGIDGKPKIIDNGSARRNAAATTTLLYGYRNGLFLEERSMPPSTREYYEFLQSEVGMLEHVSASDPLQSLFPASVATFLRYILSEQAKKKASEFLRKLATGEDLSEGSPILTLRNKLIRYQQDLRDDKTNRKSREDILFIVFRAWLHYLAGEPMKRLQWRKRATEKRPAEEFPYLDDYSTGSAALRRVLKEMRQGPEEKKSRKRRSG